jgi:hypothetical protein
MEHDFFPTKLKVSFIITTTFYSVLYYRCAQRKFTYRVFFASIIPCHMVQTISNTKNLSHITKLPEHK